jgi:NhaA family Na+:H+ antiporter
MGFTVSLLISELAFDGRPGEVDAARIGVLTGTLIAAALAAVVLGARNRRYRGAAEAAFDPA